MLNSIENWILNLGPFWAVVVVMSVLFPLVLWRLKPLLLAKEDKFQSGVYGPTDKNAEVPPYSGSHVISVSQEKCTVRSNQWFFSRRIFIGGYIFGMVFVLGLMIFGNDYLKYGERARQSCILNEIDEQTGYRKSVYSGGGITGYLYARWCTVKFRLQNRELTLQNLSSIALSSRHFPFTLMFIGLLGFLYFLLKPAPPPIVFDRQRRLVYTQQKGKVYVSDWDTLSIRPTAGHLSSGLGIKLYTKDKQGNWKSKWFSLAGYHYNLEFWINYLWSTGLSWKKRWEGMRGWLILFMDKGPDYVHAPVDKKGFLDFFVPFRKKLPEDIEQQALKLIGKDKAPGDEEFRLRPEKYPRHIKELYKFWKEWKTYLNQTIPKNRRDILKGNS